jgi:phospholipase/lecithinase/hemolysin
MRIGPILIVRVVVASMVTAAVAAGAPIHALYFFGDSLTDSGNVYRATSVLNSYTFGLVPVEPAAPYVGGRFTDGPVWAEYTASMLGRSQDAAPGGMSLGWLGQIGGPGNNYAVGGARTGAGGALGFFDFSIPTGMSQQVKFYLSRHNGVADSGGAYFLLGGGNDLRDAAKISDANQRRLAAIQAGANIAYDLRDLYFAGAHNFVLINSPDVGLIPESLNNGLSAAATDASLAFNQWLGLYADYLRAIPGISLEYFDLFALHHELVEQYGMGAVQACKGGPPGLCQQTLFFDSIHPTTWVHQIIGQRIADQIWRDSAVPYFSSAEVRTETPEPAVSLIAGALAVLIIVRRKGIV